MKPVQLIDFLNEIEERFPVDKWVIDGIHVWPILRIQLTFQLDDFVTQEMDKTPLIKLFNVFRPVVIAFISLTRYFIAFLADIRHNDRPNRPIDALFLNHTTCRVYAIQGKWYDIFCEPIIARLRELNKTGFILEFAPGNEYRIPRFNASLFIQPRLTFINIRSALRLSRSSDLSGLEGFADFVDYFRTHVPEIGPPSITALRKQVSSIRLMAEYFKNILRKTGAALGFVVTYYGSEGMAFNLACRETGVPSVDIQHGLQGSLHPAYGRWRNVPDEGYALLPDIFWCWSRDEADVIREWSDKILNRHKAIVGGNLALNVFKENDNEIVRYFDQQIIAIKDNNNRAIHILVTLQNGRGVPDLIRQVIAASPATYFWWIRLHPAMMAERDNICDIITCLNRKNVNIDEASGLPLYALLRHMDIHITETSSVVIEADHFGVLSVIINQIGAQLFAAYLHTGKAVTAYTSKDLTGAIQSLATSKSGQKVETSSSRADQDDVTQFLQNCFHK